MKKVSKKRKFRFKPRPIKAITRLLKRILLLTKKFVKRISPTTIVQKVRKTGFKNIIKPTRKKFIFVVIFFIVTITSILLIANKPYVRISFIENSKELTSIVKINSYTQEVNLNLDGVYRITTPNGNYISTANYTYNPSHFSEGLNELLLQREINVLFFRLISSKPFLVEVEVDRIKPSVEVITPVKPVLLLEDANITLKTEVGSLVKSNGNLIRTTEAETETITLPSLDGDNQIILTIEDVMGNVTTLDIINFFSFKKEGYERFTYGSFTMPISKSVFSRESYFDSGRWLAIPIIEDKDKRCDRCGYYANGLLVLPVNWQTKEERVNLFANPGGYMTTGTVYINEIRTNRAGITANFIYLDFDGATTPPSTEVHYIFELNGVLYDLSGMVDAERPIEIKNKVYAELDIVFQNLVIN